MTTIAIPQSNSALRFGKPLLNQTFLQGVVKQGVVKFGIAAAIFAAAVAMAYLVLPRLEATGLWAYAVGFMVQATTAASIMVPIPGMATLVVMSQELDLVTLAVVGAAGGAIGELLGYWLGSQGRGPLAKTRMYDKLEVAMRRWGGVVVFLFAAVPVLPMDAAGIVAGATRYPVARYLVAMFTGKFVLLMALFLAARPLVTALSYLSEWMPLGQN